MNLFSILAVRRGRKALFVPNKAVCDRNPIWVRLALVIVLALCAGAAGGTASSAAQARVGAPTPGAVGAPSTANCVVRSLPAFVAQGEEATAATVADVIEVECSPDRYGTGSKIKVTANQLFSRCKGNVTWYVPNPFKEVRGNGVSLTLDADGNGTVALLAGPGCATGESLVTAHMEEEPFETFTTSFTVLPPMTTPAGVFALPSSQVEDALSSSVATIVQVEVPGGSEKEVHIGSEELFHRCRVAPHLRWIRMNGTVEPGTEGEEEARGEVERVKLDNDGNAFVIAIGDASCAEGPSLIEADLESKPFTTFTTSFTILPPQPTAEPSFSIEKLQRLAGGAGGFTKSPLTGSLGQTVDYQIRVTNTGNVPLTFSAFTDLQCDPGTIAGGPGTTPLAPGHATTYTCHHVLASVGSYINEASVTGTPPGEVPIAHTSNPVETLVPGASKAPLQISEPPSGGGPPAAKGVGAFCAAALPGVHLPSGPKRGTVTLRVSSEGIRQITFYLDGHKLKSLRHSQAQGGKFALTIDARKLSFGAHTLSVKALPINALCASVAGSGVIVRPRPIKEVKFTG